VEGVRRRRRGKGGGGGRVVSGLGGDGDKCGVMRLGG
jgi:hypothetical protein